MVFIPAVVASETVAPNEKVLSPPVTSPFVPSSKKVWVADPPIVERSPTTVTPVLVGVVPLVTATVSKVLPPAATVFGLAEPIPLGFVEPPHGASGDEVLRGEGAAAVKSAPLLSV